MLKYKRYNQLEIIEYIDKKFSEYVDTRKSTFDYLFLLGEGVVSQKSAKQSIVASSTMQVEAVACFEPTIQAL